MDRKFIKIVLIEGESTSGEDIYTYLVDNDYQALLMSDIRNSYPAVKRAGPDLVILGINL